MRTILIILLSILFHSCKTHTTTKYKIATRHRNYYTDKITVINGTLIFYESNRKGKPKVSYIIPYKATEIITSK